MTSAKSGVSLFENLADSKNIYDNQNSHGNLPHLNKDSSKTNKKEVFVGSKEGDKIKINVIGEAGKSLYEKMQKNLNKFKSQTKEPGKQDNDNSEDDEEIRVIRNNECKISFITLIFFLK